MSQGKYTSCDSIAWDTKIKFHGSSSVGVLPNLRILSPDKDVEKWFTPGTTMPTHK